MRRGQAALEFLSTYGWMLIIILIMMTALNYFGVMNPRLFAPNTCTLPSGLGCVDFRVDYVPLHLTYGGNPAHNHAHVKLHNGFGREIDWLQLNFTTGGEHCRIRSAVPGYWGNYDPDQNLLDGESVELCIGCWPAVDKGVPPATPQQRFKGEVIIQYRFSGETLNHTLNGWIDAVPEFFVNDSSQCGETH